MKTAIKKIKVLQFRNDQLYHILQTLQIAMLQLLKTPAVTLC